ncbi:MAG: N-acetylmuramoyl-L-alanine amidase [Myxococcales bacterium]|nr:N-acetylmuramoyl-L-alanine amidase [Myxococcales bacterium]
MLAVVAWAWAQEGALPFEGRVRDGVFEAVLHEPIGATFEPGLHDELLELAAGASPPGVTSVRLFGRDARTGEIVPVEPRLPVPPPVEEQLPAFAPADNPGGADGALVGKAVYLSACHGWLHGSGGFVLQRPVVFETVEDFHNPEALGQILAAYLENAGARVYTVKERDPQPLSVVVDDGEPGYAESGGGFVDGLLGWGRLASYPYGVDPFDAGGTRKLPSSGGAVASWTLTVPEDGMYAVYVSWDAEAGNAPDAHYRIVHPGGVIHRYFDQRTHGSTWQYVERLWLTAGTSLTVELVGDGAPGAMLSADAVRIGGGMGIISRDGATTGRPRWESGGILGAQALGAPPSIYDSAGPANSDPSSRSRWADWEHPIGEPAVYVGWHSNAGGGRGTSVYFAGGGADTTLPAVCSAGPAVTGSGTLATLAQSELVAAAQSWDTSWQDRGVRTACFAEVGPHHDDEMPSVLLEHGFHDDATDAALLKSPQFRRDSARAVARSIVRYFAQEDGVTPVFAPSPPDTVRATHEPGGGIRLAWSPGPTGIAGDPATGYLVFTSADGRSWDNGFAVTGTTTVVTPPYGARFWRIVATNDGGQSFPSEVVGASHSADGFARVLVVAAFDRLDTGLLPREAMSAGTVRRMFLDHVNDGTIIVPHGLGIVGAGWTFDSASDEALPLLDLSAYDAVVWATGEESTVDESFSSTQQVALAAYVANGGGLVASGAEILWDLDAQGSSADQTFAADVLGASMQADTASTNTVSGQGVLFGLDLTFGHRTYPVEYPDVLSSTRTTIATYGPGEVAAVMGDGVALFGFPLDAVDDPSVLADVFAAVLPVLAGAPPDTPPPVTPPPVTPPPDPPDPPGPTDPPDPDPTDPPPLPTDPDDRALPTARRVPLSELDGGCGCRAQGVRAVGGLAMFLPIVVARRRR